MTSNVAQKPAPVDLEKAIEQLNLKAVKDLLQRGTDPKRLKHALSGLSLNANFGPRIEIMRQLIACGANVNEKNEYDVTPLMEAARGGSTEAVCLLLDSGAEINAVDGLYGWTALMRSANYRSLEALRLLLERDADIDVRDNNGRTALDIAESQGEKEMVRLLKEVPEIRRRRAAEAAALAQAKVKAKVRTQHVIASQKQQQLNGHALKPKIIRGLRP